MATIKGAGHDICFLFEVTLAHTFVWSARGKIVTLKAHIEKVLKYVQFHDAFLREITAKRRHSVEVASFKLADLLNPPTGLSFGREHPIKVRNEHVGVLWLWNKEHHRPSIELD
ncbi:MULTISPECIES: hypothetical protein [Brucella]|uniref:Uncharacterized protein n=1 Tax=Brucella pinnipedialis M292/94/1 TaxID=520462 RepID=A0A0E1WW50_9HYPH|nr:MULTISPECIES: hypothetical protein [Brucella]EEZ29045.1 predicted protein [Brucella pinnipedialis M292/94/1]ENR11998.1 hypothetical protein C066_02862 [Brucella sp. UK5/01]ENT20227.1 hypothetical protein C051_02819 [Brucella sp. UK40/99]GFP63624.1 hypothetical protein BCBD1442_29820 [Brucella ceti]